MGQGGGGGCWGGRGGGCGHLIFWFQDQSRQLPAGGPAASATSA